MGFSVITKRVTIHLMDGNINFSCHIAFSFSQPQKTNLGMPFNFLILMSKQGVVRVSKFVREISLTLFMQRIVMYLLDIVNILTIQRNSLRRSNKDEVSFASPPGRIESCECTKRWLTKVAN